MKKTIIITIAVLVLVISFLVFTNIPSFFKGYSKIKICMGEATGPALKLLSKPTQLARYIYDSYFNLIGVKKENFELQKKFESLQLENHRLAELEKENKRLKSILHLVEQYPNTMIAASVIGEDLKNWFKCIIIDKGRDHGVKEKMPVITPKGVVGQAVEVNKWHSKVMIINDTNSSVDVYVDGKNSRGILEGIDQTTLKLKYVLKNDEIAIGDKLITSGKDSIYPKGIPVGIIITINRNKAGIFADVDVMPFNNYKRLDEVLIVKKR
ncbi:MAG TPA: rod shape-determining protein MreC [Syntrophorhabdaceae bacterium]|mgnify:FL=1|nr:rod shape-determining protein MreC [Syntrophorhabdaceae bacterium]HOF57298.1 rod shape-determining protein MreC [Syntrophorhabdaceae bacterium]HOG40280.1 rod shape-determining protein MreC [Syntrophorhabdaceae bacterium]HQP51327.1 rod shape-determining protein MreC [Syntrophorhabdaceae bacterium]